MVVDTTAMLTGMGTFSASGVRSFSLRFLLFFLDSVADTTEVSARSLRLFLPRFPLLYLGSLDVGNEIPK